jgi:hypothetical protein
MPRWKPDTICRTSLAIAIELSLIEVIPGAALDGPDPAARYRCVLGGPRSAPSIVRMRTGGVAALCRRANVSRPTLWRARCRRRLNPASADAICRAIGRSLNDFSLPAVRGSAPNRAPRGGDDAGSRSDLRAGGAVGKQDREGAQR